LCCFESCVLPSSTAAKDVAGVAYLEMNILPGGFFMLFSGLFFAAIFPSHGYIEC
jgi:hypothetical protein